MFMLSREVDVLALELQVLSAVSFCFQSLSDVLSELVGRHRPLKFWEIQLLDKMRLALVVVHITVQ